MKKKTLIIGASTNPDRYSYKAFELLTKKGHSVELLGLKNENLFGHEIKNDWRDLDLDNLDTVTLYLSPKNQSNHVNQIIKAKPNRVIFNPGTENPELYQKLNENGIFFEEACTLVLLNLGQY